MLTREQVAGCRATIKSDPNPGRRWRESIFVAALDSIDFLESRIAQLEAALAAATVTVPVEVVEAAEDMMNVIGVVFDNNQLTVANWVLSAAAKGKGQNDLQDAAMLIRRLCAKLPDCKLSRQAQEWIHRKGLGGDVLREDTPAQQPGEEG